MFSVFFFFDFLFPGSLTPAQVAALDPQNPGVNNGQNSTIIQTQNEPLCPWFVCCYWQLGNKNKNDDKNLKINENNFKPKILNENWNENEMRKESNNKDNIDEIILVTVKIKSKKEDENDNITENESKINSKKEKENISKYHIAAVVPS